VSPLSHPIHGSCINAGKISASAGAATYWGPDSRLNRTARVWGTQTSACAELISVILALRSAPIFKSLELSTRSEYVIRSIAHYAARNEACGWRCPNGDLLKRIFNLIKSRTAPLHLCHIKQPKVVKGHLLEVTKRARQACELPRAREPSGESSTKFRLQRAKFNYTLPRWLLTCQITAGQIKPRFDLLEKRSHSPIEGEIN
jgi:ribonuclease HI